MKVYYDERQRLHDPQTYLSRGQLRRPQEVPARSHAILAGLRALGHEASAPTDHGRGPIERVHDAGYLHFLETGHRRWHEVPEDWGEEIVSNVFVRPAGPPRGILADTPRRSQRHRRAPRRSRPAVPGPPRRVRW